MESDRFEESEPKISKYNAAVAQLYRIDNLWQQCHYYRLKGNLKKWNDILDCVWTELAADSAKPLKQKFYEGNKLLFKAKTRNQLNQKLMFKEIFLRELQNKQGKGTAYQDDDEGL